MNNWIIGEILHCQPKLEFAEQDLVNPSCVVFVQMMPNRPTESLQLSGIPKLSNKSEENAKYLNNYWQSKDSNRKQLVSLRTERIKEDKEGDTIDFELVKGEYKLDQADRRLRFISSDLDEIDFQLQQLNNPLNDDATYPEYIWSMKSWLVFLKKWHRSSGLQSVGLLVLSLAYEVISPNWI